MAERTTRSGAGTQALAVQLVRWQKAHGRHQLPWQGTRDPYRVWLSEVMLQQTQVSTVLDYYARFLLRFPDVQTLAAAPLDDVLALWSGLGYYSRARNLHRCAQAVVAEHGGHFPGTAKALETLPGIGRSTAAAIAAFCFGERVAILDGNVKRVISRALAFEGDLAQAAQVQALWTQAQLMLPQQDIEAYTQGLMDLGATVCHRTRPSCADCPWQSSCLAHQQGREQAFPVKTRRLKRGRRQHALLWLRQGGSNWLVQRPSTGVWASLWSLPQWEDAQALADRVQRWPGSGERLPTIEHSLTHFDWQLQPLRWTLPERIGAPALKRIEADLLSGTEADLNSTARWVADAELQDLGLPAPIRKLLSSTKN